MNIHMHSTGVYTCTCTLCSTSKEKRKENEEGQKLDVRTSIYIYKHSIMSYDLLTLAGVSSWPGTFSHMSVS